MAYESPIKMFSEQIIQSLYEEEEKTVVKCVQKFFPEVDKDELKRALEYDRGQYEKGYSVGKLAAMDEIVRCNQCRFTERDGTDDAAIYCQKWDRWEMPPDGYCWLGKRREDGDT